jgi:OPA family glycerol-3-phosphate transporter-like MFS transporter
MWRRFANWFPMGMTYAFLYMARYNLTVSKNALGSLMSISDFGTIFGFGTLIYGLSFLLNGPLVDKIGGKKGILIAAVGAAIANIMMGVVTYLYVMGRLKLPMIATFSILYSINMFFQSYGAVSIIKVKAYWFHVRERGMFGSIFGTLLSFGIYFALDWGQAIVNNSQATLVGEPTTMQKIFRSIFAIETGGKDPVWLVFFIPAFILMVWALIDLFLVKDTPGEANFEDFDTHDASSGTDDGPIVLLVVLKKILTNPIMLTIAAIEFTGGVLRNGIVNWYFIFAKDVPQVGAEFFKSNWGLILAVTGSLGGLFVGWASDHLFHSRRGPPAAISLGVIFILTIIMTVILKTSPVGVAICCVVISLLVISVHSLMSGTAAADFGGKRMTATASGITDGFVYIGSAVQSFAIGYLVQGKEWTYWPMFLSPFPVIGLFLAWKMWHALPDATRKYLSSVEKVDLKTKHTKEKRVKAPAH